MKVKTKNPIVLEGSDISPRDYYTSAEGDVSIDYEYLPTEEVSTGDVKVVTKYPIVLDGSEISPRDYYSNASGRRKRKSDASALADAKEKADKTGAEPTKGEKDLAKQKGLFWDGLKKNWQSFTQSETGKLALAQIDAEITARREQRFGSGQGGGFFPTDTPTTTGETQPMSRTAKVLLIGGGLVVVGLILYSVFAGKASVEAPK